MHFPVSRRADIWSFGALVVHIFSSSVQFSCAISLTLDADPATGKTFLKPNERATLTCRDYGTAVPEWLRRRTSDENLTKIAADRSTETTIDGVAVSQLIFNPVKDSDGGEYVCKQSDSNSARVWLNVASEASVITAPIVADNSTDAVLHCYQAFNPPFPLIWTFPNGTIVQSTSLANRADQRAVVQSASKGYALALHNEYRYPDRKGIYSCQLNITENTTLPEDVRAVLMGIRKQVSLEAKPDVRIDGAAHGKSKSATKGEPFQLKCIVQGHEDDTIRWFFDQEPENKDQQIPRRTYLDQKSRTLPTCPADQEKRCNTSGDPRIMFTWDEKLENESKFDNHSSGHRQDLITSILYFTEIKDDDRGTYLCMASNRLGDTYAKVEVRVKDKLAALWPFLGIVAEVVILCIIIFIYEKRRNKATEEEDETTEPMKGDLNERDSVVRSRKA